MRWNLQQNWHSLDIEKVFGLLESNELGLSEDEAGKRLASEGFNEIPGKNGARLFEILLSQLRNPFAFILAFAAVTSLFFGHWIDALIIAGALFINATIGFFQEFKAKHILQKLREFVSYRSRVMRDGNVRMINSREIVVGDLIVLRPGEKISADGKLLKSFGLKVNQSILTGESLPVEKIVDVIEEKISVADRVNMVFSGTTIEEGTGLMIVTATGADTEFGKIASLIQREQKKETTPLQARLNSLAKTLGVVFLVLSLAVFILGAITGQPIIPMLLTSVAVAVAAVPEGLPVGLTVVLAVGARRIFNSKGLLRKLVAAETLGNANIILTDKTGTLTQGKMRIVKLVFPSGEEISSEQFPEAIRNRNEPSLLALKLLALITNAVAGDKNKPEEIYGSAVDKAILATLLESDGISKKTQEAEMPRIAEIPFQSLCKYSVTLNKFNDDKNIVSVLGAPEVVFQELDQPTEGIMDKKVEEFTSDGFRVLALGFKVLSGGRDLLDKTAINGLTPLALVVFADPIRKEVKEAVRMVQSAGVRPVMVTGDHLATAEFVARELGISRGEGRGILGSELPLNLDNIIDDFDVFARVTPDDKVRILEAFQRRNGTTAMIGDGVNDAPALVKADIGVAVGSGTDVAKESSDLILLNNSFSIIVEAIKQGRIILDNIKKMTIFLLSGSFSELILIVSCILLKLPLPFLPAQILWVNVIEDGLPAVGLAFEKEESGVMNRKPEGNQPILNKDFKFFIGIFALVTDAVLFLLFYYLLKTFGNIEYARTMVFVGLGLHSLFYVFSIKSLRKPVWENLDVFSNLYLNAGFAMGILLYGLAIYVEPVSKILGTVPLGGKDWLILITLAFFNILVVEAGKVMLLRKSRRNVDA